MRTSSGITTLLWGGLAAVVIYLLLKSQSSASQGGTGGFFSGLFGSQTNPYGNPYRNIPYQLPTPIGYNMSESNVGYSLNDLFGPGPNASAGNVGNGGAVDPSINTGSDFNGSESDPAGELGI
jgi:hypothetical protein